MEGLHSQARLLVNDLGSALWGGSCSIAPLCKGTPPLTLRIPGTHNDASICRIVLDLIYDLAQLVHTFARVVCIACCVFCAKVAPLEAVHWPKVACSPVAQAP